MELWEFKCPKCGYTKQLLVGSHNQNQTLSDLNEDFADFRVFICPKGKELHSFDVHNREFDKTCPIHQVKLQECKNVHEDCPKCGETAQTTEKEM